MIDTPAQEHNLTVPPEAAGQRLDKFLSTALPELSRSRLKTLIEDGRVSRNGASVSDASERVKPGSCYRVALPAPEPAEPQPEHMDLDIVYEDSEVIVIDKPPGLVVHPAAGHASGTLVNALLAHCGDSLSGIGGIKRPGIVHRLDKGTSGLLVVAKTDQAHRSLSEQFAAHGRDGRLHRAYLAIVWGVPSPKIGRIEAPLGRKASNRTKIAIMREGEHGRHAVTHYRVLETFPLGSQSPVASLVKCKLETGRTHQIRVHLAHMGHPLLGDATYGSGFVSSTRKLKEPAQQALARLDRPALHAAELAFEHPKTRKIKTFQSELPHDIAYLQASLKG